MNDNPAILFEMTFQSACCVVMLAPRLQAIHRALVSGHHDEARQLLEHYMRDAGIAELEHGLLHLKEAMAGPCQPLTRPHPHAH